MDTPPCFFSAILLKGGNPCNLLFAFLNDETPPKKEVCISLQEKNCWPNMAKITVFLHTFENIQFSLIDICLGLNNKVQVSLDKADFVDNYGILGHIFRQKISHHRTASVRNTTNRQLNYLRINYNIVLCMNFG